MNDLTIDETPSVAARPRFAAAIWTLLLLAPFIGELLSGSTRTSILFVYIPEIMVWGAGALLCRELVSPSGVVETPRLQAKQGVV